MIPLFIRKIIYRDYFSKKIKIRSRLGCKWLLAYGNHVDRKLILKVPFEDEQIEYFSSQIKLKNFDVFIDVGANFGLYSLTLGQSCPSLTQIFAIEAQPKNYYQLCANIFANEKSRLIKPILCGASSENKQLEFLENISGSTGTSRIAETAPADTKLKKYDSVRIDVKKLDELVAGLTDKRIAIKIDVEGHELEVLKGAKEILARNKCMLQIELLEESASKIELIASEFRIGLFHKIGHDHYFSN